MSRPRFAKALCYKVSPVLAADSPLLSFRERLPPIAKVLRGLRRVPAQNLTAVTRVTPNYWGPLNNTAVALSTPPRHNVSV